MLASRPEGTPFLESISPHRNLERDHVTARCPRVKQGYAGGRSLLAVPTLFRTSGSGCALTRRCLPQSNAHTKAQYLPLRNSAMSAPMSVSTKCDPPVRNV